MEFEIVPIKEGHVEQYHGCLDAVAREGKFLSFTQAPPLEKAKEFVRETIQKGLPAFVALVDGRVVGWCDINVTSRETMSHVGTLGMGIDSNFRGLGIGSALIKAALDKSKEVGIEKVELGVFESNSPAIRLYEKVGFDPEGKQLKKIKLDGRYESILLMGKFL
jgi:RimJ/RimL family protein N-acetyltransferase